MEDGRAELFDTAATPIEVGVDEPPAAAPQSEQALLLALHCPALAPATNAPGLRYGRILRSCLSSAMDLKLESMLSAITAKKNFDCSF